MIDNTNWEFIRKIEEGYECSTNVLYVPTISPEKDKMCMHFTEDANVYMQKSCVPRNAQLMEDFFQRELKYLTLFQGKPWCPEIFNVDYTQRKILVEFNIESLNKPIRAEGRSLDNEFPNWKQDLFEIIKDVHDSGYFKASLYPHCFFYTNTGQLKMIDYYATIEKDDTLLHKSIIEPIIGVDSQQRFIEVKEGDYYQMRDHFKNSMKTWIKWPGDPLPEFYNLIVGNNE